MAESDATDLMETETETETAVSSLTTQQLQQQLKQQKQRQRPLRLMFEIPSSRIVEQLLSRHVVYQIVVLRSGSFSRRVSVERRYTDFWRLHQRLQEAFRDQLEDLVLPRKLLTGNFSDDIINERRRALQDYLAQVFAARCARRSSILSDFLTEPEQRGAHGLLRAGRFGPALQVLQDVLEVQEKLLPWQSPALPVPTLAAIAVCHRDLDQPEQAFDAAHRVLVPVRRYGLRAYRAAVLELLVDLGYQLGRPVARLQEELTALRDNERGEVSPRSLKEVVVQQFL